MRTLTVIQSYRMIMWVISSLTIISFHLSTGLKILSVLPFPQKSHHIVYNTLIEELVHRGHDVTVYSGHRINTNASNYKHYYLYSSVEKMLNECKFDQLKNNIGTEPIISAITVQWFGKNMTEETLCQPQIKALIRSNESFDVLLLETMFAQEAFLGFSYRFSAPVVTLSSFVPHSLLDSVMGNPNPLGYLSSFQLPYDSDLTFYQKLRTLILYLSEQYFSYYENIPHQEAVMLKHFKGIKDSPLLPIMDMLTNMAAVLVNVQPEVTHVRAYVPNMIYVGGLHIPPTRKPLPKNIMQFMDESSHGIIYFSLGSTFFGSSMPQHMLDAFVAVFRNLSERVVWKIDKAPANLSRNVMTVNWAPQADILDHPKCKAFITHGGLLSLLEATHFGVPLIGIPLFADQGWNVAKIHQAQIGIRLNVQDISFGSVDSAIKNILHNPMYQKNIQQLSAQMRNRLRESPLDTAVHWVEYVAKHQGAPQLRSPARNMCLFQYFLIDVLLFFICFPLLLFVCLYKMFNKIYKLIFSHLLFHGHKQMKSKNY